MGSSVADHTIFTIGCRGIICAHISLRSKTGCYRKDSVVGASVSCLFWIIIRAYKHIYEYMFYVVCKFVDEILLGDNSIVSQYDRTFMRGYKFRCCYMWDPCENEWDGDCVCVYKCVCDYSVTSWNQVNNFVYLLKEQIISNSQSHWVAEYIWNYEHVSIITTINV